MKLNKRRFPQSVLLLCGLRRGRTHSITSLLFASILIFSTAFGEERNETPETYLEHCANCHGREMEGKSASSLSDSVWQFGRHPWDFHRNITHGIASVGMPPFSEVLSPKEIGELVDVLAQGRAQRASPSPLPASIRSRHYEIGIEVAYEKGIDSLTSPWGMAFGCNGDILVTDRIGELRIIRNGSLLPDPVSGTPTVHYNNHGGLLDVALDKKLCPDAQIYLSYSASHDGKSSATKVARGTISETGVWTGQEAVFEPPAKDYSASQVQYGGKLAFDQHGNILFSIGDRGSRTSPQDLSSSLGKIHRLRPDLGIPPSNPFLTHPQAIASIFAYGVRNPQGLYLGPQSRLWETEHGPMGGDELNLIEVGENYGWALTSYGINYDGSPLQSPGGADGTVQPIYYWVPSIGISAISGYQAELFSLWKNDLFVASIGHETLERLVVVDNRVIHHEPLMRGLRRIRDIEVDKDGRILLLQQNPSRIIALTPIAQRWHQ